MTRTAEVLTPTSVDDAVSAFGDGVGVTVIGGGTIVMPELARRQTSISRALVLSEAGLSGIVREGAAVRIAAATPLEALIGATPDPLSSAAQGVGDYEVRGQATIGGNLCARPGRDAPRGDLQAPLVALGAVVRSASAGARQEETVEEFLAVGAGGRLLLEIEFAEPKRGVYLAMGRPHAHVYTAFCVACVEATEGTRVAIGGVSPVAVRARSVEEALAEGASPDEAAARALEDVEPQDDAMASAWYRTKTLPTLVARALTELAREDA